MDQGNRTLWLTMACLILVAAVLVGETLVAGQAVADDRESHANKDSGITTPVLVELFTSQGCSSCPSADRLLSQLTAGETEVIPLSFHVDYWNYIGWTDPFSSAEWSKRQSSYANAFDSSRVYTPQLVVNGRRDCVGSNEKRVREEIERAAREGTAGRLELEMIPGEDTRSVHLEIDAYLSRLPPSGRTDGKPAGKRWSVMVAVFENDLETPVSKGENGGRTLRNSHVVRTLTEAFSLPARAGASDSGQLKIELADGWNRERLGVAVFLQDPVSRHIHGAAVRYLSA